MMHRDSGTMDEFETLCSIPVMKVQRIRLRRKHEVEGIETRRNEAVIVSVLGSVTVAARGVDANLAEKDVCYLPPGSSFSLRARGDADVVLAEAPATQSHPAYVKRFSELKAVSSGSDAYRRQIYTAIGEKDPANRFIVGFVEGDSGNWTSFPPHRHDGKPEVYVYYGMGKRFGVQIVSGDEDMAFVVHEGDAVLFEKGYHPNVATPGVGMKFVWIISADPKDRNLTVELHPDYGDLPMGQTHLTTK